MTPGLARILAGVKESGSKAFIPYVTAGLVGVDGGFLRELADAGADALEVGIPFSDPVMDGLVIQEASRRALAAGCSPATALALVAEADLGIPVVVMTYLNPILAYGEDRFVSDAAGAGVAGVVVPDLPVDEAGVWIERCRAVGLAPVFLAAPNSRSERLREIALASEGFVYCVSAFGVTGAREQLEGTARGVVEALRRLTEKPLLVGVGISTPLQAREACRFADGVVVGSALMGCLLRGSRQESLSVARGFRVAAAAVREA